MDINKLAALRELALRKTMTEVAKKLHLSPSAVSQQIAQLEEEVGIDLIERRGRGVELTLAGERLVEHANRIFYGAGISPCGNVLSEKRSGRKGTSCGLSLGCCRSHAINFLLACPLVSAT